MKIFRSQFRTIIVGGGTDGGVNFMAEQLNHTDSEVLYFDFSTTSMSIAQHRSKYRRGLKVVWVIDWIESIPRLGLGKFDLAVSTGVLHHLKSPQKGLSIVNDVQLPDGGAEFMVYGTYGRTPIYWIQKALRLLNEQEHKIDAELKNAKHILRSLPKKHFFHINNLADHKTMGDIGIYDLLLHKRDVSFTTLSVNQWLQNSGYNVVDHTHPENTIPISLNSQIEEKWLYQKMLRSSISKVGEMGEIIFGWVIKQDLYASKRLNSEAKMDDLENTSIYAYGSPMGLRNVISGKNDRQLRNESFVFSMMARSQNKEKSNSALENVEGRHNKLGFIHGKLVWPLTKFNTFMLESITKKPIRPISVLSLIDKFVVETNSNMTIEEAKSHFETFYSYIKDSRMFFLKHKSVPTFPLTCCSNNMYTIVDEDIKMMNSDQMIMTDQ